MRRKVSLLLAVGMALSLLSGVSFAEDPSGQPAGQKQPSPEEMQQMMQATMQGMAGPMIEMMKTMFAVMAESVAEKKFAENLATFNRNYYDALVTRGFSEEEAMRIVSSAGLPSVGGK